MKKQTEKKTRGRKYETVRDLKKDELGGQELILFQSLKRSPATVAEVMERCREALKSKSKNLQSCVAWYLNHMKKLKLLKTVKV